MHSISYGCVMAQAVSCHLEGLGSTPGKSTWICGGQIVTGTGFIRVLQFSCTIPAKLHSYSFIYHQHLALESIIKQHTSTFL